MFSCPPFLCSFRAISEHSPSFLWCGKVLPIVFKELNAIGVFFLSFENKFFSGPPCEESLCSYKMLNMAFGNGKAASLRLGIILEGPPSKDLDPSSLWPCHGKLPLLSLFKTLLGSAMMLWAVCSTPCAHPLLPSSSPLTKQLLQLQSSGCGDQSNPSMAKPCEPVNCTHGLI